MTGYRVERCQGAGCTDFTEIATSTTGPRTATPAAPRRPATRYRVRAERRRPQPRPLLGDRDRHHPRRPRHHAAHRAHGPRRDRGQPDPGQPDLDRRHRQRRRRPATGSSAARAPAAPTSPRSRTTTGHVQRHRPHARRPATATASAPPTPPATSAPTRPSPPPPRPRPPTPRRPPRRPGLAATAVSPHARSTSTWTARHRQRRRRPATGRALPGRRLHQLRPRSRTPRRHRRYSDTGRAPSTSYSYRVRADDAAGNLGPYSAIATATTPAAPDTTPPTAPPGLAATAVSPTQINLTWTAATDNVGVTSYRVERCQGAGCTNFTEIATADQHHVQRHRPQPRPATATGSAPATPPATSAPTRPPPPPPPRPPPTPPRPPRRPGWPRPRSARSQINLDLEGRHRQRRRDRLPGRALPGRRLHQLHRDRHPHRHHLQRHRPLAPHQLQLPRPRRRRRPQPRPLLRHRHHHHPRRPAPASSPRTAFDEGAGATVADASGTGNNGHGRKHELDNERQVRQGALGFNGDKRPRHHPRRTVPAPHQRR